MKSSSRPSILIVDDDDAQRVLITRILSLYKVEIHEAGSGPEAIDAIRQSTPDLIILDIQMPEMNGVETLAAIRKELGESTPPIIGLSGSPLDENRSFGFSDYILKPFSINQLADRIRHFVQLD